MLKATLRQPCLQTQPDCPPPGEAAQNLCVCRMAEGDTEGDTGCWQEMERRGGQRCHQLRGAPTSQPVEQEGWTGLVGGKTSGSCRQEPGVLNRDALVPALDGSNLASATELTAPPECPSSAPELPPPAASPVADDSQEWKVVKIQRVIINPTSELRKVGLSRSASLSEKELKEAKARSRKIAAQLTTEGEGQDPKPEPGTSGEELRVNTSPCREPAEVQQVPLSIYLKENMASAATNGVQEQATGGMQSGVGVLRDAGAPAGPRTVALAPLQSPEEGKNGKVPSEVPSKVPSDMPNDPKMLPGPPLSCGVSGPNPLPKTGILEESAARRGSKKSMFTFVEKPKLGPNPDLLDLVQSADSRKKQKEQGKPSAEDEPFALGAEAANFVPNSTPGDGQHLPPADNAPAWSSCLKSPTIQPKPKPQPSHNLSEARGKGAELFARRQSRMEKFIIEAPSQPELLRSPSPTMSLPPSWKYDANACLSPMVSRHPSKSPSRPSKTPPASLYGSNLMENEVSQKELEISKHQPYQLQSSLFILSPSKGPTSSVPCEMPPPRPSLPNAYPYPQQTSCPTSPLPPSPVWHPPTMPSAGQTTSSPFPSTAALPLTRPEAEVLLGSPCRPLPPRAKGGFQAPRPSYSTRNAGIEPQERRSSLPASPTWTPRLSRRLGSLDGWASPASVPELDEGPPMSPAWSERSLSPLRQDIDPRASRQMQARLARNIINAARRKSSSPKAVGPEGSRPFTPIPTGPPSLPQSPRLARLGGATAPRHCKLPATSWGACAAPRPPTNAPCNHPRQMAPSFVPPPGCPELLGQRVAGSYCHPARPPALSPGCPPAPRAPCHPPWQTGSPWPSAATDSDVSLDSEDSGAKSPGIHSFRSQGGCHRGPPAPPRQASPGHGHPLSDPASLGNATL
ncbi:synaptopodin [Columba livia]|uniref:Synaptopodin n=1 Tax=Columba livia TaxID=8932 RepID=A0A2I0MA79_COLLI|nr:synaptopodin [Columba livia]